MSRVMRNFWHRSLLVLQIISATVAFHLQYHSVRIRRPGVSPGLVLTNENGAAGVVYTHRSFSQNIILSASESDYDGIDDDEAAPALDSDDWRAFRAKLVLGNQDGSSSSAPSSSSSSSWAYDSGHVIEPGSIILAKVEPDFCYFGLNQQYFHKSVMLVTYHKENEFTKGIILNRPTNLFLGDEDFLDEDGEPYLKTGGEIRTENSWRIWYGGDVRGLYSDDTEIICLHSVDTDVARNVSEVLLNGVMMTNYEGALTIINAKEAKARDFWMFAGYAGWTGGQLLDELNRESWYMVSADSEVVWNELIRQRDEENADPRDAGLKTWTTLMNIIGKGNEAKTLSESFADLTLKEWAAEQILFNSTAGNDEMQEDSSTADDVSSQLSEIISSFSSTPISLDKMVNLAVSAKSGLAGSLLRGSTAERSPFLLTEQKFHKSILLILQDDDYQTVGVMLNHPTTRTRPITLPSGETRQIPVRYGGSFGIPGVTDQPTIFLHAKTKLKELSIGEPVGRSSEDDMSKIWICTEDQAIKAIAEGHASHNAFFCVEGLSVWNKDADPIEGGILLDILEGKFELVDPSFIAEMLTTLAAQRSLSIDALERNCRLAFDAWAVAGKMENSFPQCVYDSSVTVSELSDDASRYWIEAFLLGGVVSAGGKYSAFE